MMQLITADHYGNFVDEIAEMHRLRYRVFKGRLDWDVHVSGDMEIDEFDALRLLVESDPGRALPATSGIQLYREVSRVAERTAARTARSAFLHALVEQRATRRQLIGYALEYAWIVRAAPGLSSEKVGTSISNGSPRSVTI